MPTDEPRILVMTDGPYRVCGDVSVHGTDGTLLRDGGDCFLCRCGGSRNKPFCDATHGIKAFDGTETGDHRPIAERRSEYPADGITVYDDRTRCAHFGQCTTRLASVFRADQEPFIDASAAPAPEVAEVIRDCPSGALAYGLGDDPTPVERPERPSITPIVDGPYRVRGSVTVVGDDGRAYEARERQALCRCGQSRNKPFCDGSHWYAEFRDPVPAERAMTPPTLYEWAGGLPALERLTSVFYDAILAEPDPVLEPIFRHMAPDHPAHVAAWLAETFGGPPVYTREHGGYERMLSRHRDLGLTGAQRSRWLARMVEAADQAGLPADPEFRSAFVAYLEWGTRLAVINSEPGAAVTGHAPVPKWGWGNTPPFQPQPWDDPDAAERGRLRYERSGHREEALDDGGERLDRR